jgi:hypothetical protein
VPSIVALATLLGPGAVGRGAADAGAVGAGCGLGAAGWTAGEAGAGAAGICAAVAGVIIIVPLKRADLARGSNSLPHARHLLACSVTAFPQLGQNAMEGARADVQRADDRNVSL